MSLLTKMAWYGVKIVMEKSRKGSSDANKPLRSSARTKGTRCKTVLVVRGKA